MTLIDHSLSPLIADADSSVHYEKIIVTKETKNYLDPNKDPTHTHHGECVRRGRWPGWGEMDCALMLGLSIPLKSLKRNSYEERQFLFKIIKMIKILIKMKTNFLTGQNRLGLRR